MMRNRPGSGGLRVRELGGLVTDRSGRRRRRRLRRLHSQRCISPEGGRRGGGMIARFGRRKLIDGVIYPDRPVDQVPRAKSLGG